MIIGVPKETKRDEYRVGLLPVGADELTRAGHKVLVETGAGVGSGLTDKDYADAGAELVKTPSEVFSRADMIIKVKEPQSGEIPMLRRGQIVFTYFHLAADRQLTESLMQTGSQAVAYETLADERGRLPLLTPMSEVAGRMSVQEGAKYLERPQQGRGILLGGVPGVEPAHVVILGGGIVGSNAARVAAGLGANVVVMDVSIDRLRHLDEVMPANVTTLYSDPHAIDRYTARADLVIGAVLIPGAVAPKLLTQHHLTRMKAGAVLVDVSIDQGGCAETSRPTTHHEPTYIVDKVVHYCVTNIPGAVGRTSSYALCNATLPYARQLAWLEVDAFCGRSPGHTASLNLRDGRLTHRAVADAFPDLPHA